MTPITAIEAAERLAGCESLDPRGLTTAADIPAMCQAGQCFDIEGGAVVLAELGDCLWIDAMRGHAEHDLTDAANWQITEHAQRQGLRRIGLQTGRSGLVRKLQARGFVVTGWIMQKAIACTG